MSIYHNPRPSNIPMPFETREFKENALREAQEFLAKQELRINEIIKGTNLSAMAMLVQEIGLAMGALRNRTGFIDDVADQTLNELREKFSSVIERLNSIITRINQRMFEMEAYGLV